MLNAKKLLDQMRESGIPFFAGVPDSQLKAWSDCLMDTYGIGRQHMIAANEGNAVGLAAGYHLATGQIPCVYMQNSGIGNIVNPVASLLHGKVYAIPCLFIIGWRGEPGVKDEPQHIFQGEITIRLLESLGISTLVLDPSTSEEEFQQMLLTILPRLKEGKCAAFVVRKGALCYGQTVRYENNYTIVREEAIRRIVSTAGQDAVVCTTGKASRELFEIREANGQSHQYDFLTVGSMGHSSMIALGAALYQQRNVWCIDGDGALLMHMGSMAVIGSCRPKNFIHIVLNNGAHETVGGMPTPSAGCDFCDIAKACGYPCVFRVSSMDELGAALKRAKNQQQLTFLEIMTAIGSRKDLGRPTTTALENKENFMNYLKGESE